MSDFWYFLPHGRAADVDAIDVSGIFAEPPRVTRCGQRARFPAEPGGLARVVEAGGLLIHPPRSEPHVNMMYTETTRLPNGELLWIGWPDGARPHPAGLLRAPFVAGEHVRIRSSLAAGDDPRTWLVPVILPCTYYSPGRRSGLPSAPSIEHGAMVERVDPRYAELEFRCWRILQAMLECDDDLRAVANVIEGPAALQLAADVLAVRHRVGLAELIVLEEIAPAVVGLVLAAATDLGLATLATAEQRGIQIDDATRRTVLSLVGS